MIFTFYSFKGGVGRSMALANVAELLYRRGLNVLMVDFDLEAPGLERFFEHDEAATRYNDVLARRGIIDMLLSYKELRSLFGSAAQSAAENATPANMIGASVVSAVESNDVAVRTTSVQDTVVAANAPVPAFPYPVESLTNFLVEIYKPNPKGGALYLLPAGRRASDEYSRYAEKVRNFQWDDFYIHEEGERFFDWLRKEMEPFDAVLIDSRTGLAEMTGVCTHHLADVVVMFAATSRQNVDGCARVAQSLSRPELVERGRRGRPIYMIMVPSRVEPGEGDKLDEFAELFKSNLAKFNSKQLEFAQDAFVDLRVPYVPFFAYSEDVATRPPEKPKAAELIGAYNRLCAAMVELAPRSGSLYRKYYAQSVQTPTSMEQRALPVAQHFSGREWVLQLLDEWLGGKKPRVLLITGSPGSGKTALAARLAQISDGAVRAEGFHALRPGWLAYAHFCTMGDLRTLDPKWFVQELARNLAVRYPAFARALTEIRPDIKLDIRQTIGANQPGSRIQAVHIERFDFASDIPARVLFDELVRRPLMSHLSQFPEEPVVLLVDGMDAADSLDKRESVAQLVAEMAGPQGQMRPNLRFVLTGRLIPLLERLDARTIDLVRDHPVAQDDVFQYVLARLDSATAEPGAPAAQLQPAYRGLLARQITDAAQGNMLYAEFAVNGLFDDRVATALELLVLRPGSLPLSDARFSADGLRIVTAGNDACIRVWDTRTGKEVLVLRGHGKAVQTARFSPDGTLILSASMDTDAMIWDSQTGKSLKVLVGHDDNVQCADFSSDGKLVVTASVDGTARVWDIRTGACLLKLAAHHEPVFSAQFSLDGSRILTAGADRTATLWDSKTGNVVLTLRGHDKPVLSARFSPDGTQIVTASEDETARLWDTQTGAELGVFRGHGAIYEAEFSSTGRRIVSAGRDGTALGWDLNTGANIFVLRGHEGKVFSAQFSTDDSRVITAGGDGTARVWDTSISLESTLPLGLDSVYRQAVKSVLMSDARPWAEVHRPFLGALAVAFDPLEETQICGIVERPLSYVVDLLLVWMAYLEAWRDPNRPSRYQLYHSSFRDFLLTDRDYGVFPAEGHASAARHFLKEWNGAWQDADDYALRHTPRHFAETIRLASTRTSRQALARQLGELLADFDYLEARSARFPMGELGAAVEVARGGLRQGEAIPSLSDAALMISALTIEVGGPDRAFDKGAAEFAKFMLSGEKLGFSLSLVNTAKERLGSSNITAATTPRKTKPTT